MPDTAPFSRRERQIMDLLYRLGTATAAEIHESMSDPPSYSGVRTILRVLVEKGHITYDRDGSRYVYRPTVSATRARESALRHVVRTFFGGSTHDALLALLGSDNISLSTDQAIRLRSLIEEARTRPDDERGSRTRGGRR